MNVPSFAFLGFAAVVAVLINVSKAPGWRRAVFLLANLAFVSSFMQSPAQLAPFAGLLAFGFVGLKLMEKYKNRPAFVVLVIALVVSFCTLKRYTFVPSTLFLPYAYFTVGMSYVFFRVLHLVIDGYQGTLPHRVSLLSYANYTLNFTSLVSGPIQRYPDYDRMEGEWPAPLDEPAVGRALERLITGFFKVTVLSPLLSYAHDRSVAWTTMHPTLGASILDAALVLAIFPMFLVRQFLGVHGFRYWSGGFSAAEAAREFQQSVRVRGFHRILGTLAHDALRLDENLYLFAAGHGLDAPLSVAPRRAVY